ncbi:MAG: hypothetical protein K2K49_05020 [Duncaniella sp.]|nr:hypothetical protein [Duncaniella sp.]
MDIINLFSDTLFSVKFDDSGLAEYHRFFNEWKNLDYLTDFFEQYREHINTPFWLNAGLEPNKPEQSARRVIHEADLLETQIKTLALNSANGTRPDLDSYFQRLGGKYNFLWSFEPHKSYGPLTPSLLRVYAIKIEPNCYLIVHGGIKLGSTIQNSPVLKDMVFKKIDLTLNYLDAMGIVDSEDI